MNGLTMNYKRYRIVFTNVSNNNFTYVCISAFYKCTYKMYKRVMSSFVNDLKRAYVCKLFNIYVYKRQIQFPW